MISLTQYETQQVRAVAGWKVVFPTLFMIHIIPGGRSLVSGFVDGAAAANVYLQGLRAAAPGVPAVAREPDADRPVIAPA